MDTRIEIPRQVQWILEQLTADGHEAFVVGGCVRDSILGREPEDWDITTSAKPEQVKAVFPRTVDTGIAHGTVTVLREGCGYEVTTYRIDGEYEDGRHPKSVAFTGDLTEDLRRRDFTINAMAYSREAGLVDVFGGLEDLEGRTIRCVGDATERFGEDALRVLRAVRFGAQLDFSIEEVTLHALGTMAPNLENVSRERIQVELTKLLLSAHPERIRIILERGIGPHISAAFCQALERAGAEEKAALCAISRLEPIRALRWAGFLRFAGESAGVAVLKDLKMDNDTISKVRQLLFWLDWPMSEDPGEVRKLMSQMSDPLFDCLLELWGVHRPQCAETLEAVRSLSETVRSRGDCIRMKDMAVTGDDLLKAGIEPGKQVGQLLSSMFQSVLEQPTCNHKETLLAMVEEFLGRHP